MFDQRGIAERFVAEGQVAQAVGFAGVRIDLTGFPTRYPYSLGLWQNHIERLLGDWGEGFGVPVYRGVEVRGFTQHGAGVDISLSDGSRLAAQYLVGREIVAVCAPKLARGIRSAQDLLSQPLLYHSSYADNWALWAEAAGARLLADWRGTGFDLVLNLIEAARAGMGVAVVQKCMVEADLAARRLAMPVAGVASTGRGYYLCRRRALGAHPAAERFSQWVLAQAALSEPASPARRPATG